MHALTAPTPAAAAPVAAEARRRTNPADSPGNPRLLTAAATLAVPTSTVLSKRQQEILHAACEGVPDKAIAAELGVSPRTLEGHWRAIHHKLGTTNRCQAGFLFAALRKQPRLARGLQAASMSVTTKIHERTKPCTRAEAG